MSHVSKSVQQTFRSLRRLMYQRELAASLQLHLFQENFQAVWYMTLARLRLSLGLHSLGQGDLRRATTLREVVPGGCLP